MKSVKKLLSLLLVAMLLVTAIPFAASAADMPAVADNGVSLDGAGDPAPDPGVGDVPSVGDVPGAAGAPTPFAAPRAGDPKALTGTVGATQVQFTVYYAVKKGTADPVKSAPKGNILVSSTDVDNQNQDKIRNAIANAGYAPANKDTIVNAVSAAGHGDDVYNVVYGDVTTEIKWTEQEVLYILAVTDRPNPTTTTEEYDAPILLDEENTGLFVEAGHIKVKLVKTEYGGTNTYTMAAGGDATVTDIRGVLGADFNNKALSMVRVGPSTDGKVSYKVTVTGTNGSTGTNVPGYDATLNGGYPGGNGTGTGTGTGTGSGSGNGPQFGAGAGNTGNTGSTGTTGTTGSSGTNYNKDNPTYSEVPGNVYLEIYTNKNFGSYDARFSITNNSNSAYNIGTDGSITAAKGGDLWNLLTKIYTAKNSNGMEVKLYQFENNNFPADWAFGNYYTSVSNLTEARQWQDITIRVAVNNVYRKTADSSNPKTGDTIMISVAVLGITASGLAAAYYFSKKRKTV